MQIGTNDMRDLAHRKCFNHASREAVAICLECRRFFCRECVTEHEDRVVCAVCLRKGTGTSLIRRFRLAIPLRIAQGLLALFLAWAAFNGLGRVLLLTPTSFHEGAVWPTSSSEEE